MTFGIHAFNSLFLPKPKVKGNAHKTSDRAVNTTSQHTLAGKLASLGPLSCPSETRAQGSAKFTSCWNAK